MNVKKTMIEKLYPHRQGIMGTVIFHLLLAIFLLSMEISKMKIPVEMEILMEAPPQEELQKAIEEKERKDEILKKTSAEEVEQMLRSIATNENVKEKSKSSQDKDIQKYIDEVKEELNGSEAGRYKVRKDKNFKRDSLQNARDKREQKLDSLKSTFYSGKSSVSYNLKERFARFLPIPVFKCEFGGKVVVMITVNQKGVVQKAVVAEQSRPDDCLSEVAVDAALRSRFNEKSGAPALQTGTITYNFVKQ